MTDYEVEEILKNIKKWYNIRMRMIKRCVAHKAQNSAQRYRDSIATSDGLIINNKIERI
jgi:flavorubredoxin